MIEPPGQPRIGGIFEIYNCVDIAVEQAIFKKLRSFMGESGKVEGRARVVFAFEEAAEERGGCGPVETMIVIQDSHPHAIQTHRSWKTLQVASRQGSNASRLPETPRTHGPPRQSFRCINKNNTRSGASCGLLALALLDVVLVTQHFQVFQSRLP